LLHGRQATKNNAVSDHDVATENSTIGERHVVADIAIVADVAASHEITVRTDTRNASASSTTKMHRHTFADDAVSTDDQARVFKIVAADLRLAPQNRARMLDASRSSAEDRCGASAGRPSWMAPCAGRPNSAR